MHAVASAPFTGIIIGALAGGIFFIIFGLMRAAHMGGLSAAVILHKFKGRSAGQSPFVRIMVAAGIFLGIALGMSVAMVLGGVVGGVIESTLVKIVLK